MPQQHLHYLNHLTRPPAETMTQHKSMQPNTYPTQTKTNEIKGFRETVLGVLSVLGFWRDRVENFS